MNPLILETIRLLNDEWRLWDPDYKSPYVMIRRHCDLFFNELRGELDELEEAINEP